MSCAAQAARYFWCASLLSAQEQSDLLTAEAQLLQGLYLDAIELFEGLCSRHAHTVEIAVPLAVAYREQGWTAKALTCLTIALQANPDCAEVHFELAQTLRDLDDLEQAEYHFLKASQYNPEWLECLVCLALVQRQLGKPEAAIGNLDVAISAEPWNRICVWRERPRS